MHCHKKVQVQSLVSSNPEEGPYLKKKEICLMYTCIKTLLSISSPS